MVADVADVDDAVGGDCHPERVVELGGVAASGEGGDLPGGGVNGPDPVVAGVAYVDGAVGGYRHPERVVELGGVAGAVGEPGGAASGEGGDGTGGGVDGPDPIVVVVGDIDGAVGGDRHPCRVGELGVGAGVVSKTSSAVSGERGDDAEIRAGEWAGVAPEEDGHFGAGDLVVGGEGGGCGAGGDAGFDEPCNGGVGEVGGGNVREPVRSR